MYVTDTLHQPSADCEAPDSMERTYSSETAHQHILTQRPREAPDIELFNVLKKKKCVLTVYFLKNNQNPLCLCRSIHREII